MVTERTEGKPAARGAVTSATRVQASSISKQFVAASAMLLVEHGDLTLFDPISRWLPSTPPAWSEISLHHLLSQTSGLGHWASIPDWDVMNPTDAAVLLETAASVPLLSEPGATWRYSGPGFVLASEIVAAVAGESYSDFVAERIFRPHGMTSTTSGTNPIGPGVATGHRDGEPVALITALAGLPGTGDLWTTVDDLVRYTTAFHSGRVVGLESVAQMTAPQTTASQFALASAEYREGPIISTAYGYGYFLGSIGGESAIFHPGDNPGFSSLLACFPESQRILAILTDDENSDIDAMVLAK